MNLVVDIGNTQVKAAAVEGTTITALETFPSAEQADLKPILARYPIKGPSWPPRAAAPPM